MTNCLAKYNVFEGKVNAIEGRAMARRPWVLNTHGDRSGGVRGNPFENFKPLEYPDLVMSGGYIVVNRF